MKLKEAKRIHVFNERKKRLKTNGTQGRWLNRIDDSNTQRAKSTCRYLVQDVEMIKKIIKTHLSTH